LKGSPRVYAKVDPISRDRHLAFASQLSAKSCQVSERAPEDDGGGVAADSADSHRLCSKRSASAASKTQHRDRAVVASSGLSEHRLVWAANEGNGLPQLVSAIGQCRFLEYATEAMDDSAFGLHPRTADRPARCGAIFLCRFGSSRSRRSARALSRYCRIANEASDPKTIEFEFVGLPRYASRHNLEYVVTGDRTALRTITGRNVMRSPFVVTT
jgi:hypothetical protein